MNILKILFSDMPREVGIPNRIPVYSFNDLLSFIRKYNGVKDVFVSLYQLPQNNEIVIDKIFFDFDYLHIDIAYRFFLFLKEKFGNCIPIFSGRKGFHFHVLLKRKEYTVNEAKKLLKLVSYTIIDEARMYRIINNTKVPLVDTKVIGDVRRMVRVPGTLRIPINSVYCTVLPEDFGKMNLIDLFNYASKPHDIFSLPKRKYYLDEIEYEEDVLREFDYPHRFFNIPIDYSSDSIIDDSLIEYIVRPCILTVMKKGKVPDELKSIVSFHDVCTALAVDLFHLGLSYNEVLYLFKILLKERFNERYTRYQIDYMLKDGLLHRYSCRWFKERGLCVVGPELNKICNWWIVL